MNDNEFMCWCHSFHFFLLADFVLITLTSCSFGAKTVMCLFSSCSISNAVKLRVLIFTVLKPAVSVILTNENLKWMKILLRYDFFVFFFINYSSPCTSGIKSTTILGSLLSQTIFVLDIHFGFVSITFGTDRWNATSL